MAVLPDSLQSVARNFPAFDGPRSCDQPRKIDDFFTKAIKNMVFRKKIKTYSGRHGPIGHFLHLRCTFQGRIHLNFKELNFEVYV